MPFAVCSAVLLILAFPPFDAGGLAWIALVPWLFELERSSPRRAFGLSVLTGFLFFVGTVWWVGYVTVSGMLVLAAYLSLYLGLWGWFVQHVIASPPPVQWRAKQSLLLFTLPAAWVLLEYVRSFLLSGFGWNLLAHTQWNWIPLIQIADLTGVWGVSFLLVLANTAAYQFLRNRRRGWVSLAIAGLAILAALGYGTRRIRQMDACTPVPGFKVALLQGNIPQKLKWDESFQEAIWKRYEELTVQAAAQRPDLIVWPETAVPGFFEEISIRRRLAPLLSSAGTAVLAGVPTEDLATEQLRNTAVLLAPDGMERGRYDKLHLVPFGEFIPFKPILGWLENVVPIGDFSAGRAFAVFPPDAPVRPFSVLICFEDIFPGLSRRFVRAGADWLLVITNDGWFGRSAASLQHLQCSVFRAVEGRVWVGRAANTGWTGFIDAAGRRAASAQIPRFQPGVAMGALPAVSPEPSFYVRWGDGFVLLCLALTAWALFPSRRRL